MRTRLDAANRNFLVFTGVVVAPYVLLALVGCGLLSILVIRAGDHGLGALTAGRGDLRPAALTLLLVGVATALAVWSFRHQMRATRSLAARVRAQALPVPDDLSAAASRIGLAGRIDVLDDDEPFSFAYGLLRPRIVVSRGLLASAQPEELLAVLEHERYHVRQHDPLKVVVARAASSAYFFLPALRGLRGRYAATSELAADRRAIREHGRGALAGALYKVVRGPAWDELSTAAAIGGPELLEVRVSQIESGREPAVAPVSRTQGVLTVAAIAAIAASVAFTVVTLGGPGAIMREVMGSEASMQDDMGMGWNIWSWLALLAPVGLALWLWSRHRPSRVDTTQT